MKIYPTSPAREAELKKGRPIPPCRGACPVDTDVQGYLALIARRQYLEAFELIRSVNPLPSVCSLICHHPCERECRRKAVDQPLAIRPLKRFVTEAVREERQNIEREIVGSHTEKIAVIGGGPAGLTVATDMALRGFKVTIFEKESVLGGQAGLSIPTYRLPRPVLQEDIDDVLRLGVEAKTGVEVGKDITLDQLKTDFDAVVMAVGMSLSRSLPLPNIDAPGVQLALPFLTDANLGRGQALSGSAVVVGGGNVAIDVARTARRLGADHVEMVCLESEEEMPAWEWEVEEASDEGIHITHRRGPKQIVVENGAVAGLEVKEVERVFDDDGRFNPTYFEDKVSVIPGAHVIIAIGQMSDVSMTDGTSVKADERGRLEWDRITKQTSDPKVFACGEVVTGPGAAIEAVASGHMTAKAVELFLAGGDMDVLEQAEQKLIDVLPDTIVAKVAKQDREELELLDPVVRSQNFEHIEIGYDEAAALREARRCRSCGAGAIVDADHCVACLTCMRLCPYDAPLMKNDIAEMPPEVCQACGLCAGECPGLAIDMIGYDRDEISTAVGAAVNLLQPNGDPVLVAFQCVHHAEGNDAVPMPPNVAVVPLSCTNWLDVKDILHSFECGADGVYVATCGHNGGSCKYTTKGESRIAKRLMRVGGLLEQAGLGGGRVQLFETGETPENEWPGIAEQMTEKVKQLGPSPFKAATA